MRKKVILSLQVTYMIAAILAALGHVVCYLSSCSLLGHSRCLWECCDAGWLAVSRSKSRHDVLERGEKNTTH